jgi:LPS sulfotransferase NodH
MPRELSYLVCATPRSGSTLLCELLKDTGVAGRPEEYYEARAATGLPPHPGDFLRGAPPTGAGIRSDPTPPRAPEHSSLIGLHSYRDHLDRSFELGTTPNGVFGAKLMWGNLPDLQQLAGRLPEFARLGLYELLDALFGAPRYVWMTRRDKVRQAVSLWRALQTRSWRLEHSGEEHDPNTLQYSYEGIDHLVQVLRGDDAAWGAFFAAGDIDVLTLSYEDDLERDRTAAVRVVLDRLGVRPPDGWHAQEVLRRQADGLSEEWIAAYYREAAQHRGEASAAAVS